MAKKPKTIFFTGAGISFDSGIPTFQDQPGIRDKLHRDFANSNPEEYRETIRGMLDVCENATPNAAHNAIAKTGFPVITMNIDLLHTKAGSKKVVEVHGVLPTRKQLEDEYFPIAYGGLVLYGDEAPNYYVARKMVNSLSKDDYFVIVGTSFYTGISSDLLDIAVSRHARGVVINDKASEKVPIACNILERITATDNEDERFELYQELIKLGKTLREAKRELDMQSPWGPYCWG